MLFYSEWFIPFEISAKGNDNVFHSKFNFDRKMTKSRYDSEDENKWQQSSVLEVHHSLLDCNFDGIERSCFLRPTLLTKCFCDYSCVCMSKRRAPKSNTDILSVGEILTKLNQSLDKWLNQLKNDMTWWRRSNLSMRQSSNNSKQTFLNLKFQIGNSKVMSMIFVKD